MKQDRDIMGLCGAGSRYSFSPRGADHDLSRLRKRQRSIQVVSGSISLVRDVFSRSRHTLAM
jgi:hypothetical protein